MLGHTLVFAYKLQPAYLETRKGKWFRLYIARNWEAFSYRRLVTCLDLHTNEVISAVSPIMGMGTQLCNHSNGIDLLLPI